jgi:hypothetical protein
MTAKQKILSLINKLDENATIDQAIDELYFLKKLERALEQADSGDVMDHDEFMRELQDEDEESSAGMDHRGANGPQSNKKVHRPRRAPNRKTIHKPVA